MDLPDPLRHSRRSGLPGLRNQPVLRRLAGLPDQWSRSRLLDLPDLRILSDLRGQRGPSRRSFHYCRSIHWFPVGRWHRLGRLRRPLFQLPWGRWAPVAPSSATSAQAAFEPGIREAVAPVVVTYEDPFI